MWVRNVSVCQRFVGPTENTVVDDLLSRRKGDRDGEGRGVRRKNGDGGGGDPPDVIGTLTLRLPTLLVSLGPLARKRLRPGIVTLARTEPREEVVDPSTLVLTGLHHGCPVWDRVGDEVKTTQSLKDGVYTRHETGSRDTTRDYPYVGVISLW